MEYGKKAVKFHSEGCNCCQAVLMSCSENYGITEQQAYRMGAFFGGGMRCGEVCGAVSGALMALGLQYGDENNRQCDRSKVFLKAFEQQFGSLLCRELLAKNQKQICPVLIEYCANYLEEEFK